MYFNIIFKVARIIQELYVAFIVTNCLYFAQLYVYVHNKYIKYSYNNIYKIFPNHLSLNSEEFLRIGHSPT